MSTGINIAGAQWGGITGTLSNQTDLQTTLNTLSAIDRGRRGFSFFTDFLGNPSTSSVDGLLQSLSTGTITTTIGISGRTQSTTGAATHSTAASATGFAYHLSNTVAQLFFSGGQMNFETLVSMDSSPTSLQTYRTIHGFGSDVGAGNELNGVFFTYDWSSSANGTSFISNIGNWICVSVRNGVRTISYPTLGGNVNPSQFYKLRIEVNAAGTSAAFYINGTLVATHTTNIPQYFSSQFVFVKNGINKTVGTTPSLMYTDYLGFENILTTPR
jgi:hypothetical protein